MSDQKPSPLTLRDVYRALYRHKFRAGGFFLLSMVVAAAYVVLAPRTYDSEGKLFVRLGRENATLDPSAAPGHEPIVTIPNSRESEINTVAEMLASRPTIENVVTTVGAAALLDKVPSGPARDSGTASGSVLEEARSTVAIWTAGAKAWLDRLSPNPSAPLNEHDKAVILVSEKLSVYPAKDSAIINISFESHSPELSRAVVNSVIGYYLEQHGRLNRNDGAHAFFAEQKAEVLENLTRTENGLRDLRKETGPGSFDGQRVVVVDRIARLEDELAQTRSGIAVSEAKVGMLREKLAAVPAVQVTEHTSGVGNAGTDLIRAQYHALLSQEKEAASKYTEDHPRLQHVREQIVAVRAATEAEPPMRTQVTEGPGEVHKEAQLALLTEEPLLASLHAKGETLETQLVAANAEWDSLNENDLRMAKLQRDIELHEADYRKYATNFEQTRIDEALQRDSISNINVLQQATFDVKPVSPRKPMVLAFGLLIGSFGGLALALLADHRNRPFATPEEVETDLNVPTLASIPRLKRKQLVLNGRN